MKDPHKPPLQPLQPRQAPSTAQECSSKLDSTVLFGTRDEVLIAHGVETYRLRRTRQGKLILTK